MITRRALCGLGFLLVGLQVVHARELKIGIIGDQTLAPASKNQYEILQRGISVLKVEHPDVVLHTGDLVESTADFAHPTNPDVFKATFNSATGILNQLGCHWYLTAGDHDVSPPWFSPADDTARKLFQALYPPAAKYLYYSFNERGYHFIALSSQEVAKADPRWGVIFRSHISPEQLNWLSQDLAQNARARGIIVFLHQPLWYQWADWAPVHSMLRKARVTAVVAGHFHYNQDEGELDGIRYIVVGATGASTKAGSPEAGDLQHVSILRVDGHRVRSLKILSLRNEQVQTFSSRRDMDRVQALDINIANAASDTSLAANRIRQVGETNMWRSCAGDRNGFLALRSVGNPLDIPVTVRITPGDGNLPPVSSGFNPKICPGSDGTSCELPSGSLIDFSNNSSVQPSFRSCNSSICSGQTLEPLWTAQFPLQTSDGKPAAQSFVLSMSFRGISGKMLEVREVFAVVSGCGP